MGFRSKILNIAAVSTLSMALAACSSGGGSTAPVTTPPVVVNTPPVINVTVNSTTIAEGEFVQFEVSITDDTSVFDPSDLAIIIPDGFQPDGSDPADSFSRQYFAEAVNEDTSATFSFSVTDDEGLTTTETVDVVVQDIVKDPSDEAVFQSETGTLLGSGTTAYIGPVTSTETVEAFILDKFENEFEASAFLERLDVAAGGAVGTGISDFVGPGNQFSGAAIETLKYGTTDQNVFLIADYSPSPRSRLDFRTGLFETEEDGFVDLQSFGDNIPTPCAMTKGKIESSTANYNDVVIGLEDFGIRLFTNQGNLGTPANGGLLTQEVSTHITNAGTFCDISLFGDPVQHMSAVDFDTGFIHIWENEFGSFAPLKLTNANLPAGEVILGYDAIANTEGSLVHAIISSTGESSGDTQRLTIIVTDENSGMETLRRDISWTSDRPTSVFVGDLSAPMAETSDKIDILMAIPSSAHAGIIRDERADIADFSDLFYGDLSFAPATINIHDFSPTLSPNNANGGFIALSSSERGPFRGPIFLYDVPE